MSRSSGLPTLKVDGGGLLFAQPRPNPLELAQAKLSAEGVAAAYNLIGYDAVGVARLDLAAGPDFLKSLAQGARFAWLSANLLEQQNGRSLFSPYISRKLGDTRVAIIGITSDQPSDTGLPEGGATIKPWAEILPPLVLELSRSHDFLILLTDLPPAVCGTVARQLPAINLIINATSDANNQPPRALAPATLLAATGRQGKYAGALEITWSPGGHWGAGEKPALALRDKLQEVQRSNDQLAEIGGRPELESQAGNLRRRQALLQQEIAELRTALAGVVVAFFTNSFQAMAATVGEEPGVAAIVAQVRGRIAELGQRDAAAVGPGSSPLPDFSGWQVCASCHPKAAARWQSTPHAGAYATLGKKNRQFAVDCLLCHVTGGEVVSRDRLASLPQELRGVGCEVCHGPSRRHAEGQEKSRPRQVPANICQGCHVFEHDGSFDFAKDVELVRCDR